jgi:hypothetical protein
VAFVLISAALWQGKRWWDAEDLRYRNNRLYHANPMKATARAADGERVVRLTITGSGGDSQPAKRLIPDHGKLMHLFLIREPELDAFAHVHPLRVDAESFDVALPPLPAGRYRLYSDITYENGFSDTLTTEVELPPTAGAASPAGERAVPPDADDSWFVEGDGGLESPHLVRRDASALRAGEVVSLAFAVQDAQGGALPLDPYLGMLGHAAVRRSDGTVFAHLHPVGTISMAAQSFFEAQAERFKSAEREGNEMPAGAHHHHAGAESTTVSFPYEFPQAGRYRLWVQAKAQGRVVTGVFDLDVAAAR